MKKVIILTSLIFGLIAVAACGSGSSNGDSSANTSASTNGQELSTPELFSLCGSVLDALGISNPVPAGTAERVSVEARKPDTVVITRLEGIEAGNAQAVKLHGIALAEESGFRYNNALNVLKQMTAGGALFVPAGSNTECQATFPEGGVGVYGHLYSLSGENVTEAMIETGGVVPTPDPCLGVLLNSCYSTIEVAAPETAGMITDFLWKPKAESQFNPGGLIIHASPCNSHLTVNGETGLGDFGPGNGRCTTWRYAKTGCSFGRAIVEIYDSQGRLFTFPDGNPYIIIENGCNRVEFKL
ncbi:MAG: hypothetical protein KDD66_06345 [Bdellovibrionales bacterium]|nr:hypothetical protein [Bdellovibrionales bacterium]